jgi:hypothetical protein
VASFIVAVLAFLRDAGRESMILNMALGLFMLATALLFIPRILSSRKIESKGDLTGATLDPLRVQLAQLVALLSVIIYAALRGWAGVESLMPLWAAILGISLYAYLQILIKRLFKVSQPD